MKRINLLLGVVALILVFSMLGCEFGQTKWEYKTIDFGSEGHDRTGDGSGKFHSINPSEESLNKLGIEGWELVTSYLEMETAWVNFGNNEYVTGLQPNVRPQRVVFVFKRKLVKRNMH